MCVRVFIIRHAICYNIKNSNFLPLNLYMSIVFNYLYYKLARKTEYENESVNIIIIITYYYILL